MKQFFITVAGVFVGLVLFLVGVPLALLFIALAASGPAPLPGQTVLSLDLRQTLTDQEPADPLLAFTGPPMSVTSTVLTLRRAETDDHVKAMVVRLPDFGIDPAQADELAQAFRRFRAKGKKIYVHSQGLYAGGVVTASYALGAAGDEFWMQAGAPFEAVGISVEDIFFKRFFERYGVEADYEQREDYKNAVNPYLFADYTPAHKEAQVSWMQAVHASTIASAAHDRKRPPEAIRAALEAGPYDAALQRGLVDRLGFAEEMDRAALKAAGDRAELVDFLDYQSRGGVSIPPGDVIAVINVEGAIVNGVGSASPFGGAAAYSDIVADAIYSAIEEEQVQAIVLRVSSPGGSDTASEQIAAAVRAAKAANKPVVVSMGAYAASGGYWISTEADHIVAQPTTLTGSIGVYGGKFAGGEAAARFGIDVRETTVGGEYAGVGNLGEGFSPAERAAYAAQIDKVYQTFLTRVSTGRKLPLERVRQIAGGRVWTGAQARDLGLVDQLGGLTEAIDKAKALAGIDGPARLWMLPEPVSAFDALEQALGISAAGVKTLAAASFVLGDPRAEAALDRLVEGRMRARGARVLAPKVLP
jgi:protease-4